MTFKDKLFSFQGRINRSTFFWSSMAAYAICTVVDAFAISMMFTQNMGVAMMGMLILGIAAFFGYWAVLALNAKRLHDLGKSGWTTLWVTLAGMIGAVIGTLNQSPVLTGLSSIAVFLWALYVLFTPGQKGDNRFGPQPGTAVPLVAAVAPVQAA